MAEFKIIKLTDILIPERLRAIEEEHAIAIAQSMVEHGQITPIAVRATPAAKAPYTLVAGAHRMRAVELNAEREIDAIVVKADKLEAQLMEIAENVFRNELSVIDRAIFVATYREVWQQKHGVISRGRPGKKDQVDPFSLGVIDLIADEAEKGFAQDVADRLGISKPSAKRLDQIARNLQPALRQQLRGTPAADNQALLLKLAKSMPDYQKKVALALEKGADVKKAMDFMAEPKPALDKSALILTVLINKWADADDCPDAKAEFLDHIADDIAAAGWTR